MSWRVGRSLDVTGKPAARTDAVLLALGEPSTTAEIAAFVRTQYGFEASVERLRSERDENYRLAAADGSERLFKLTHPAEERDIVDFQTQALQHIVATAPAIPIQRLIPSSAGTVETIYPGSDGLSRQARLFTFLVGAPLSGFRQTALQAQRLGVLAAQLDRSLSGFQHRASDHELLWDIRHAARTRELLAHTQSRTDRELCERTLDHFSSQIAPLLESLRIQVIHNDLNPHNVLVNSEDADELTGIIDFGDMVRAPLIHEAAVASAYLVAASEDALGTVPQFVASYHAVNALEPAEIDLLPSLIAVRHAITIAITNWRASRYPENRDYILRNHDSAVAGLQKLFSIPASTAREVLQDACSDVKR